MKTMKAQFNQFYLVIFLAVILIAGSVHAEGTEMNIGSCLKNSAEPKLEMEKWMVSESYWYSVGHTISMEYEQDKNLLIEAWMVDKSKWQPSVFEYLTSENDQKLMVENWMIHSIYWNEKQN